MSEKKLPNPRARRSDEGDIHFEISFFETLIQKDPNFTEVLIPLAEDYTRVGRYEDGLKIDLKLAELLPKDETVHYNLACSFSLLSQIPQAFEALKKAIQLGYDDFEHMEEDPDLANLRAQAAYEDIKKKAL